MTSPTYVVADNFLANPDEVRKLALGETYSKQGSAGLRSSKSYLDIVKPADMELLLGIKIGQWNKYPINGRFQFCTSKDPLVYHSDTQRWAASLFLTPDAPLEAGLSLLRSRHNKKFLHPGNDIESKLMYGNFMDRTLWDECDRIGNRYNRLVVWNARHVHAASCYFGQTIEDARLFMVFFFDGI